MLPFPTLPPLVVAEVQIVAQVQYHSVAQSEALRRSVRVEVTPGRATIVDFAATGEVVSDVLLADPSRITYTTDVKGQQDIKPTAIYLREAQPLVFPGLTTAPITNLIVTTIDQTRQKRRYNFDIVRADHAQFLGVKIVSEQGVSGDILVDRTRISPWLVQRGLQVAIGRGYTSETDLIVGRVQHWLRLVLQGGDDIASAKIASVSIPVLQELVKIASEESLRIRLNGKTVK